MSRSISVSSVLALMGIMVVGVWAQVEIAPPVVVTPPGMEITPPTTAPAIPTTQPDPVPTTPATTAPTAEQTLRDLLTKQPESVVVVTPATQPAVPPTPIAVVAPAAKTKVAVQKYHEGEPLWNRVGRLVKEEKTNAYIFVFEADGQGLSDEPVFLAPCKLLTTMEEASAQGTKRVKFRVSGLVTEYEGRTYLWVRFTQVVKDLNQF